MYKQIESISKLLQNLYYYDEKGLYKFFYKFTSLLRDLK